MKIVDGMRQSCPCYKINGGSETRGGIKGMWIEGVAKRHVG